MLNLCIVEDNRLLLDLLRAFLSKETDILVTACHASAEEALAYDGWGTVDVLLADLGLPEMSGVSLISTLHSRHPSLSILVYTVHEDSASVIEAIRAGACGYLVKGSPPETLLASIREVFAGGSPMTPKIARYVLSQLQLATEPPPDSEALSLREIKILRLLESGASNKQVAADLGVSPHTIHTHIKNIYRKLQAHSRAEAVRKGLVRGLL